MPTATPRALAFVLALSLPGLFSACRAWRDGDSELQGSPVVSREHPLPTENRLSEEAEEEASSARELWIEYLHQVPPGTDWHAIERANGLAEMEQRNRLASASDLVQSHWSEVGSKNLAGRMHCATLGPATSGTQMLYAGSAHGGLWRGNIDGTGWVPLGDNLFGGVHELVVLPGEHPGEPDVLGAATDGGLFHVSRNLGTTWETPAGLPALTAIRGLATLDDALHTILVYGNYNASGSKPAVFASTDYGRTFTQRWIGSLSFNGSMWVPRKGAGAVATVYVLHKGRLLKSTNGGQAFVQGVVIDSAADTAVLAGSEAGSPTLYAALHSGGAWKLHRSDDGGGSFTFVANLSDFYESLCASTVSPNLVMVGGLEVWRSYNGGGTFTKFNGWGDYYGNPAHKLHADCFGIHCSPDLSDPFGYERWWISTDGGLYLSPDLGGSVNNISLDGLGVSQYYSTLTSKTTPNLILAGAQDQGYQRGTWQPSTGPGPSTPFTQLISGDYGHLTSSNGSHALVYSTYPGFVLVQEGETNPNLLSPFVDFPAGSNHAWLPPVVADPLNPNVFFFCGEKLYRYTRVSGPTWSYAVHSTHDFLVGSGSYLSALAFAPINPQRVYAVNDRGRLFSSSNHGVDWTTSSSVGPAQHYFYGNTLAVHPQNELEASVGGSGYGTNGVWRTIDGGVTWQPLGTGLPQTMVYGIVYAENGSGDLYAATEAGAWQWVRATNAWQNIMQGQTPLSTYWSVESVDQGRTIRYGTYGRGIWDYAIPGPGPGTWTAYGAGLGGANVVTLSSAMPPLVGTSPGLDVAATLGEKTGWIFWSESPGSTPMQGGTFLLGNVVNFTRVRVGANGIGSARFPIVNDPALVGQSRYLQALLVDPTQVQGMAFSNGLLATIGM
jgi:hypothetical protein